MRVRVLLAALLLARDFLAMDSQQGTTAMFQEAAMMLSTASQWLLPPVDLVAMQGQGAKSHLAGLGVEQAGLEALPMVGGLLVAVQAAEMPVPPAAHPGQVARLHQARLEACPRHLHRSLLQLLRGHPAKTVRLRGSQHAEPATPPYAN